MIMVRPTKGGHHGRPLTLSLVEIHLLLGRLWVAAMVHGFECRATGLVTRSTYSLMKRSQSRSYWTVIL